MTEHDFEIALIKIVAPLHDLKEQVLREGIVAGDVMGNSAEFDGGALSAFSEGLVRMVDPESDHFKAELKRQVDLRLLDAMAEGET